MKPFTYLLSATVLLPFALSAQLPPVPTSLGGIPAGLSGDLQEVGEATYDMVSGDWSVDFVGALFPVFEGEEAWFKTIGFVPFELSPGTFASLEQGDMITVTETISLLPGEFAQYPITDWHEILIGDSVDWADYLEVSVNDVMIVDPTFNVVNNFTVEGVDIPFDFLEFLVDATAGDTIQVVKKIVYNGPSIEIATGGELDVPLQIIQYPTVPEGSVLGLFALGFGSVLLIIRRRR